MNVMDKTVWERIEALERRIEFIERAVIYLGKLNNVEINLENNTASLISDKRE